MARWGFQRGDENDGLRAVCARESWSGKVDWRKENQSREHANALFREREGGGGDYCRFMIFITFCSYWQDLSEGTWAFHVDTPFQCKNINVQQSLNVVCLWIVCAAYSCCRCNSNWECKQEASVEKLQCCAAATEHFSLIKTHLAVTGENVWQLMSLWF